MRERAAASPFLFVSLTPTCRRSVILRGHGRAQEAKGKTDVREDGKTAPEARLAGGRTRALRARSPTRASSAIWRRRPGPIRLADAETFLMRERRPHEAACLIFLRGDGAPVLVGGIGFGPTPDGELEFGYWIARPFWGRGFATEAGARAARQRPAFAAAAAPRRRPLHRQSGLGPGAARSSASGPRARFAGATAAAATRSRRAGNWCSNLRRRPPKAACAMAA